MPLLKQDISKVRNKIVRSQLHQKAKKEARQAKLKRRLANKEAEARGETVVRGALPPLAFLPFPLGAYLSFPSQASPVPSRTRSNGSVKTTSTPMREPAPHR